MISFWSICFFIIEDFDIASYPHDKTTYVSASNVDGVVKSLEEAASAKNLEKRQCNERYLKIAVQLLPSCIDVSQSRQP